jgi:phosphotransferase system enzyme I (PtsP)
MKPEERDYLRLLRDTGDAFARLSGGRLEEFLQRLVDLVSAHIRADVVSVYLFEPDSAEIVLRATRGLAPEAIGRVRLQPGEGLVGMVLESLEPIIERAASQNPRFRYFPEAGEEAFESFLAVPVHRGAERLGALVVQRRERDYFGQQDLLALQVLASQLAAAIENARALHSGAGVAGLPAPAVPDIVAGRAVSAGCAQGRSVPLEKVHSRPALTPRRFERRYTADEFRDTIRTAEAELVALEQRFSADLPELAALVFSAHEVMLMDAQFTGAMLERIEAGENPPEAIIAVTHEWMDRFAALPEPYLREKAVDVADLGARLLDSLINAGAPDARDVSGYIVVAPQMFPSDVLELHARRVQGIVMTQGGETSHVTLLARSLGIPLVIATEPALLRLPEGTPLFVDADAGNIYINPPDDVLSGLKAQAQARAAAREASMKPETWTRDGVRIHLAANINLLSEIRIARELMAESVGLYRSEFPFLVRPTFPTEEEQVVIYTRLFQEMGDRPVTVRTLDAGGDKSFGQHGGDPEENPQLGLRSIRYSLRYPETFRQQLRAILRGGAGARQLRIMFPMIGSIEEWRTARDAVRAALESLGSEGLPHCASPVLGMMVEVPGVAHLLDEFAAEAEFFCIGTNDLVQYLLGVDRGNVQVADYYRADHPAVLRCIHSIVATATRHGRPVSVCGEMAHERRFIPFLIGAGVREFSVDPRFLPILQREIELLDSREAEQTAQHMLRSRTFAEVAEYLPPPQRSSN